MTKLSFFSHGCIKPMADHVPTPGERIAFGRLCAEPTKKQDKNQDTTKIINHKIYSAMYNRPLDACRRTSGQLMIGLGPIKTPVGTRKNGHF